VADGDLLVTSPTPGYAMVSKPVKVKGVALHRSGTILGKALEPLPNGKGEMGGVVAGKQEFKSCPRSLRTTKGLTALPSALQIALVAGAGFEPATFGL
jgi:hypothetical protein